MRHFFAKDSKMGDVDRRDVNPVGNWAHKEFF